MRTRILLSAALALALAVLGVPTPSFAADGDDAWKLLTQVRQSLSQAGAPGLGVRSIAVRPPSRVRVDAS